MSRWHQLARDLKASRSHGKADATGHQIAQLAQIALEAGSKHDLTDLSEQTVRVCRAENSASEPQTNAAQGLQPLLAPTIAANLSRYHERLAICLADGIDAADAHATATAGAGFGLEALAHVQADEWIGALAKAPRPDDQRLARLLDDVRRTCTLPWLLPLARAGWEVESVFGCATDDPFSIKNADLMGIATYLSVAPWNHGDKRCRLVRVETGKAIFATPTGKQFGFDRFNDSRSYSVVPIWDAAALHSPTKH